MSNQNIDQYKFFVEKLKEGENKTVTLNDIKNLITYKSPLDVVPAIRNIGITKILNCLDTQDKNLIDLSCEVLKICFEKFEPGEVVKTFTGHIMYLLRHEKDCVRLLAIDEVYKVITTNPVLIPAAPYIDIYVAVAQMVSDKDVGIANKAVLITSNLPVDIYPKILEEIKICLEGTSSMKCNVYEVIVNISSKSYDMFQLCVDYGYIDFMVNELNSDDILYHLNILELLSQLAIKPYGIDYMVKQEALQKILELVKDNESIPYGRLLTPGYMKFFGSIAHHYPKELLEKYPVMLDLVFDAMNSNDLTVLPVALDTFGFIGITLEGKLCLAALGSKYIQHVEKLGVIIKTSPAEIKTRAIYCLASLISVDKDPKSKSAAVDQRITLMTREWFRCLSKQPEPMDVLLDICKNPFPDIKLAGFILLDATCQHQWGEEMVSNVAGFIEYLLDRSIDETKELKEARYDIIKRLSQSIAFDENMIIRLQKYVEEGPFYTETTLQVAMDGGE